MMRRGSVRESLAPGAFFGRHSAQARMASWIRCSLSCGGYDVCGGGSLMCGNGYEVEVEVEVEDG